MTHDVFFPEPVPTAFRGDFERRLFYVSEEIEGFRLIDGAGGVEGVSLRLARGGDSGPSEVGAKIIAAAACYGRRHRPRPERVWSRPLAREPAPDTFARMARRGWAFQAAGGLVAVGEKFMALADHLDARIAALVKRDFAAVEYRYPTLIPSAVMRRGGYLRSFPQFMMIVARLHGDYDTYVAAARDDSDYFGRCRDAGLCLPPTMCYHTYQQFADSVLPSEPGRVVTARGKSFRFESKYERQLERLWDFTIREVVFIGSASYVEEQRRRLMAESFRLLEGWGLAGHCETANDPFFAEDDGGRSGFVQRLMALKYEVSLDTGPGEAVAAASFNLHNDFFGDAFGIRLVDGATARTACAGFGLERLAYAFLCQHGLDEAAWPAEVREAVAREVAR